MNLNLGFQKPINKNLTALCLKALKFNFFIKVGMNLDLIFCIKIYDIKYGFVTGFQKSWCSKSLGHILTLNISKNIKDVKTHLVNSESLLSQNLRKLLKVFSWGSTTIIFLPNTSQHCTVNGCNSFCYLCLSRL